MNCFEEIRNTMDSLVGDLRCVSTIAQASMGLTNQIGGIAQAMDKFNQSFNENLPKPIKRENKFCAILKNLNPFRLFSKLLKKSKDYEFDMYNE